MRVGARLRAARLAQRRTVAEVAEAAGLTEGFLSRLERDRATASVAALVRLCAALDLAVGGAPARVLWVVSPALSEPPRPGYGRHRWGSQVHREGS